MTDRQPGPAIQRIRLGARLRRLREARGVTAQQAARAIRGSDSKISRIELGRHSVREQDVADLLTYYGVSDPVQRRDLLALAGLAGASPWWQRYSDVLPAWFQAYLGYEDGADAVLSYDTHFVPGLLQTGDYAAALMAAVGVDSQDAARLGRVHAERITRFATGGWRLRAVVDEAVLRRPAGGAGVLAAQLEHLRAAITWPGVSVQVRPLSAGAPVGPAGFTILRFTDPDVPDTVCTEHLAAACFSDRPADVDRYARAMDGLLATSQPPGRTAELIDAALRRLAAAPDPPGADEAG